MNRRRFITASASLIAGSRLALASPAEFDCDICIAGGGTGGTAAAMAALARGMRVVMTEETDWIGGQLTAQAVPADEHPYIESFGCTRRYREFRTGVRNYYRKFYPLTPAAAADPLLNPGNGGVSHLCVEFRVCLAVLESSLQPYLSSGQLTLLLRHTVQSASMAGDTIRALTFRDEVTGATRAVKARYFLDATELGDLLPLTKAEFVTGAEARAQTGEMHAAAVANPAGSQGFTFCFAMDHLEGEDHTIDKPADYAFWRGFVPKLTPPYPGPQISWTVPVPTASAKPWTQYMLPNPDKVHDTWGNLWFYRRIVDPRNFRNGAYRSGATLVNWSQNDYFGGDLLTSSPEERIKYLHDARQLSLSLMYWMQTEAPRVDGGAGMKGLRMRNDMTGTEDGLAKYPYIREARRIQPEFRITEQLVGTEMRMKETGKSKDTVRALQFPDSVGIGAYKIDVHAGVGGANFIDISALPFQIPLGALLPVRVENLLPACKNIGTTHITNACYREHPTEWNIGEAAGAVAAFAVARGKLPRQIRTDARLMADLQTQLRQDGFELEWSAEAKAIDW